MKWNVGTKMGAGFGLAMVFFVIVGAVSYRSTTQLIEASDLRQHTYEVLSRLAEMELLSADMQNGLRGYVITGEEKYLEPYQTAVGKIDKILQEARKLTEDNLREQRRLDALEPLVKSRIDLARETIDAIRTKGEAAGVELIKTGKGRTLTSEIRKVIDEMEREEKDLLKQRAEAAQNDADNAKQIIVLGTLAALVFAALAGFVITRNIARPLQDLTAVAERITLGDLSVNVPVDDTRSDEVGALARTFDRMVQSLRAMASAAEQIAAGDLRSTIKPQSPDDVLGTAFARMSESLREQIRGLAEGANVLGSAASEIVASTTQLAASASQSAAAVSETTTTVEEVRQTAQVASQKAKQVSDSAQKAAQSSQSGRKSTEDVAAGMNRIRLQMEAIAASMARLSEQSQAIGRIMATVEDLAAQSNLLAVNAAIEAARAGEHGKGFGVVAQEVKSLAEQSRQATNQVRTILGDIQKATIAAVLATEQGNKAVEAGSRQSEVAGASIQALAGSVTEAAQAATQIAASSQQQLVGVDQVAGAMESIRQASTQNVAGARQLEVAARNLDELGQRLKQMVALYTV
ncbi:methyl-accepting chemotaxis protein [Polaromonas sp. JS666]|uniref:methyl-accepting chemotaxis protein n=1 Tax=Polaromonas sp. (strain JS666 / ATCC BAA-500) TaxID=296591 RepID=UPI0000536535|nr:CHASE3 domain-containing protein [Polaromonas sp. JS666]ABE44383.1 methyl-accepting chemotaxis sensory transducer [Polaromonas sp. JS666]